MIAFDTNVLVRVLVGDDPVQTRRAERAFLQHTKGNGIFISMVVLAEVAWVLAAAYEWDRPTIHRHLSRLVRTRGVALEQLELVEGALDLYASGPADFADYLVLGKARSVGANLLTFDKRLGRTAGAQLL